VPFNAVVFGGVSVNCAEASTNGAKFQFDSFGEGLTPDPSPKERGELGAVDGLNLKVILSMVREPHHDKKMI
jgi:hypothetical protein